MPAGTPSSRILVVDSTPELRETITSVLRRECFDVEEASDGEAGLAALAHGPVDLVLLDLQLRKIAGVDFLRRVRSISTVPLIAMSPGAGEIDRVLALELGADDCISIPCSLAELVSRVRALLRRCDFERAATRGPVREIGGLRVDLGLRQVVADERVVYLTASQFKLLALLSADPGRIVSRREILRCLWDSSHAGDEHVCDVHVSNLRHKIERDPRNPERIITVRGLGYKLVAA